MSQAASYPTDDEAVKEIIETGKKMFDHGLVMSDDGNISVRTGENEVWVTPSGICKAELAPELLVKVDFDGKTLEGTRKPSSETKLHLRIYLDNPEVRAVIHAHPLYATSFAVAGIPMDEAILVENALKLGAVPVVPYGKPGTTELSDSVAGICKKYNAALLSNHGVAAWGRSLAITYLRVELMENYARTMINARLLGSCRPMDRQQISDLKGLIADFGLDTYSLPGGPDEPVNDKAVLPRTI